MKKYRAGFTGSLQIYPDKIVVKGLFGLTSKTIPISKIANVNTSKLSGNLTIETSGGEKLKIHFYSQMNAAENDIIEAMNNYARPLN